MKEGGKMKLVRLSTIILMVALIAGCGAGLELNHDYDQQLDFSQFKTFQWVDTAKSTGTQGNNSLIAGRVKNAVVNELTEKGLTENTSDPDVFVIYHVGTQDKVDITDYGYGYGYGRYGGVYGGPYGAGGGGISTYNYTEGTLIVDIIDASTKQLAWRGSATGVLDENPSPEQVTNNINTAVAAILSQYPPKK
jgi:hypothetical protein